MTEFNATGVRWRVQRQAPTKAQSSSAGFLPPTPPTAGLVFTAVVTGDRRFLALNYLSELPSQSELERMSESELARLLQRAAKQDS